MPNLLNVKQLTKTGAAGPRLLYFGEMCNFEVHEATIHIGFHGAVSLQAASRYPGLVQAVGAAVGGVQNAAVPQA